MKNNEKIQVCIGFLEYLIDKYVMFDRKADLELHYSGAGDYIDIRKVVEEYFTDPEEL